MTRPARRPLAADPASARDAPARDPDAIIGPQRDPLPPPPGAHSPQAAAAIRARLATSRAARAATPVPIVIIVRPEPGAVTCCTSPRPVLSPAPRALPATRAASDGTAAHGSGPEHLSRNDPAVAASCQPVCGAAPPSGPVAGLEGNAAAAGTVTGCPHRPVTTGGPPPHASGPSGQSDP
jgi:hypothetical protein